MTVIDSRNDYLFFKQSNGLAEAQIYFLTNKTGVPNTSLIYQCFGSTTILQAFPDIRVSKADSKSDMLNW